MSTILRMTWRDPRDAVVHAVTIDLDRFNHTPRAVREALVAERPECMYGHGTLQTECGEGLPSRWELYRDEPVTCEQCLLAAGGPAVTEALAIINQRVPAGAGL